MKKQPSEGMKKMYAEKREKTLDKIQNAIDYIQEDGRIVTKKELMQITGISSGTFSQGYVKELLKANKVCQFKESKSVANKKKEERQKALENKSILELQKSILKLESKIQDKDILLDKERKEKEKLQQELDKKQHNYELLVGKYQQVLEALDALGGNVEIFLKN